MSEETLEKLAENFGIECQRLIERFAEVGFSFDSNSVVSDEAKQALLDLLNKESGSKLALGTKKISLKRQSKTEIKVQRSSGQKGTVSVVRKKRHVFVKGDEASEQEPETVVEKAPRSESPQETPEQVVATDKTPEIVVDESVSANDTPSGSKKEDHKKHRFKDLEDGEKKRKTRLKSKSDDDSQHWNKANLSKVIHTLQEELKEDPVVEIEEIVSTPKIRGKSAKEVVTAKAHRREVKGVVQAIQKKHSFERPQGPLIREVIIGDTQTVADIAQKMSVKSADVIKALMKLGVMATINQPIDKDTAMIVVEEMGHKPTYIVFETPEDSVKFQNNAELLLRAPIVTVMGHVDHGKTSLLDYIRKTKVTAKEAGGITQHIGAYHVKTASGGEITFLDTPGHAAFTAMRARGVKTTDIVILVVAADDGVMPQTVEAIQHAKAGHVPIIVAINKIDKSDAEPDRVKQELANYDLIPEEWGGDVMYVPVSAKEGTGIDNLLDAILLQSEVLELKAPKQGRAQGIVIEARLDKSRGAVASLLVQSGTLNRGDIILTGVEFGRIRAMHDELGRTVAHVGPSMPVEVLGLANVPQAGDQFIVMESEKHAREVALSRQNIQRDKKHAKQTVSLDDFFNQLSQEGSHTLNIIVKTDVQGSAEALSEALRALSDENVKIKLIAVSVGGINESDVTLALASKAVIIGFNVRAELSAKRLAEQEDVEIYYSSIIYEIVDNIKAAMNGLLGPQYKEQIVGVAEVRDVFRSAKFGSIAGCMVIDGTVKRGLPIRVLRNNVVIYQGELESLRRFKDDVSEVRNGIECGIGVKNYNDVKPGDHIEVYQNIEVART